jgi:hypothetical protein
MSLDLAYLPRLADGILGPHSARVRFAASAVRRHGQQLNSFFVSFTQSN